MLNRKPKNSSLDGAMRDRKTPNTLTPSKNKVKENTLISVKVKNREDQSQRGISPLGRTPTNRPITSDRSKLLSNT